MDDPFKPVFDSPLASIPERYAKFAICDDKHVVRVYYSDGTYTVAKISHPFADDLKMSTMLKVAEKQPRTESQANEYEVLPKDLLLKHWGSPDMLSKALEEDDSFYLAELMREEEPTMESQGAEKVPAEPIGNDERSKLTELLHEEFVKYKPRVDKKILAELFGDEEAAKLAELNLEEELESVNRKLLAGPIDKEPSKFGESINGLIVEKGVPVVPMGKAEPPNLAEPKQEEQRGKKVRSSMSKAQPEKAAKIKSNASSSRKAYGFGFPTVQRIKSRKKSDSGIESDMSCGERNPLVGSQFKRNEMMGTIFGVDSDDSEDIPEQSIPPSLDEQKEIGESSDASITKQSKEATAKKSKRLKANVAKFMRNSLRRFSNQ